ncbi:HD domain-containing phosphohydrolase [Robertmurraya korlensis]|uniref:HD domain-containing phosphohydrolase n=1 Tax=Robertmurraya korlensis TaxID=519977 RepID=UPI00082598DA|nr:HD domain-containing phosphohydrolase [Robertmurraya korlensis]
MRVINWYTISLVLIGCISVIFSLTHIDFFGIRIFILMTVIVVVLEVFPVKLPSGDKYAGGSIGYLFILIYGGFSYAVLAIFIATVSYYFIGLKKNNIPIIRLFVTIGMYVVSILAAYISWEYSKQINVFLGVILASIIFELVNFLVLEGIEATVFRKRMFMNLGIKLAELIIPVFISILVISRLIIVKTDMQLIISILFTSFFLLIVIFFSHELSKQFFLRKSTSNAFMQILEDRINPSLIGHGNRVGMICDLLLEDLGYPKRKRNSLVQIAAIHDIGKALIPTYVFRKRGDLTLSEEREYKSHPEKAVDILKNIYPDETYANWILHHHERWDGKGFPSGSKGEDIPFESRIITLANELDHILFRHKDPETIYKLLQERSGTMLDPNLVRKLSLSHIEMLVESISYPSNSDEASKIDDLSENQYMLEHSYSSIGESFFIQVKNGKVHVPQSRIPNNFYEALAEMAIDRQEIVHDTFIQDHITLDVHAQSLGNGDVTIFAHDLTPYLGYRKKLEKSILESYIVLVNILSEGKINLHVTSEELQNQLGEFLEDIQISKNSDVPKSRERMKRVLEQYAPHLDSMKVQVAVTEAVTNVLKHATGGELSIYLKEDQLQFYISDKGSGIPLHEIPKTILVSGYSSKRSLGQGFKMIAKFCDVVQIHTSSQGTQVLIEFSI